jgi:hypothetical protein
MRPWKRSQLEEVWLKTAPDSAKLKSPVLWKKEEDTIDHKDSDIRHGE